MLAAVSSVCQVWPWSPRIGFAWRPSRVSRRALTDRTRPGGAGLTMNYRRIRVDRYGISRLAALTVSYSGN